MIQYQEFQRIKYKDKILRKKKIIKQLPENPKKNCKLKPKKPTKTCMNSNNVFGWCVNK